jgi:hypothetical protein
MNNRALLALAALAFVAFQLARASSGGASSREVDIATLFGRPRARDQEGNLIIWKPGMPRTIQKRS